jgi:hypothetical protein
MVAEDAKIDNSLNLQFFEFIKSTVNRYDICLCRTGSEDRAMIRIYGSPKEMLTAPEF